MSLVLNQNVLEIKTMKKMIFLQTKNLKIIRLTLKKIWKITRIEFTRKIIIQIIP